MKLIKLLILLLVFLVSCSNNEPKFHESKYYPVSIILKRSNRSENQITYSKVRMQISAYDLYPPIIVDKKGPFQSGDTVTLTADVPEGKDRLIEILAYDDEENPIVYADITVDIFEPITREVYPYIVKYEGKIYKEIQYANTTIQKIFPNMNYWILNKNMTKINWEGKTDELGTTTAYLAGYFYCYMDEESQALSPHYLCSYNNPTKLSENIILPYFTFSNATLTFTNPIEGLLQVAGSKNYFTYQLKRKSTLLLSSIPSTSLFYTDQEERMFLTLIQYSNETCKLMKKFDASLNTTIDNRNFLDKGGDVVFICNSTGIYPQISLISENITNNSTPYLTISGNITDNSNLLNLQGAYFEVKGIKNELTFPISISYFYNVTNCGNYSYDNVTNKISFSRIPFISDPVIDSYYFTITLYSNSSSVVPEGCYYIDTISKVYENSNVPCSVNFNISLFGNLTILDSNIYSIQIQGFPFIDISSYCDNTTTNPTIKILSDSDTKSSKYRITWYKVIDEYTNARYSVITDNISKSIKKELDITNFQVNIPTENSTNNVEIIFQTNKDATCSLSINIDQYSVDISDFPSNIYYLKIPQFDSKSALSSNSDISIVLTCEDDKDNVVEYSYDNRVEYSYHYSD